MRILYIADGRSPIALNWINYFCQTGHEVHLASTYPCDTPDGLASLTVLSVAMSEIYGSMGRRNKGVGSILRRFLPVELRTRVRQWVAPISFPKAINSVKKVIENVQPDLIHAMRIPYEGMITSMALEQLTRRNIRTRYPPLLISVWGNDFTLHAKSTPFMSSYTSRALQTCDALHTDCRRDQAMAMELGYTATKPKLLLPGGGGVHMDDFYPADDEDQSKVDNEALTIINPRGFRAYVRNDTFFYAIPAVINNYPRTHFVCPGMMGEEQAQRWITKLGIGDQVELLPMQSRRQMAELFRKSQISVSITNHDGTPNTLLEAMACGCFPIAGDIASLREWITPGVNGLLVDPDDPEALAIAITNAITHQELRKVAREQNLQMIIERAEYGKCIGEAEEFYHKISGK